MSDLRYARSSMVNAQVRAELDSRDIFDPGDLDEGPGAGYPDAAGMTVDDALRLEDERMTAGGGGLRAWMPWEIIL
jgi:hypothetical protein